MTEGGHGTRVLGESPLPSSEYDVATFSVEPGWYWPTSARLKPSSGELATASRSPDFTSTATSADGAALLPASAFSAAACTAGSSARVRSLPSFAGCSNNVVAGSVPATVTVTPAVPPSSSSYWPWMPESPGVVAGDVAALAPADHLGGDRAVGAQQRLAEGAGGGERLLAAGVDDAGHRLQRGAAAAKSPSR